MLRYELRAGLSCDRVTRCSQRGPVLAARLKMADASKSGRISLVGGVSVIGLQIAVLRLPRALPAFQNSLGRRRRRCPAFGRPAGAVGGRRASAFVPTKFVRTPKASAPAGTCVAYSAAQHPGAPAYIPGNLVCRNEPGTRYAAKHVLWTSDVRLASAGGGGGVSMFGRCHVLDHLVPHAQILFPDSEFC